MSAAQRSYPEPIKTVHGDGWLIGKDPDKRLVCVQFTREKCTDAEMLERYSGDNWCTMIPEGDVK